jgi:anti-sigma factor RsiW
MNACPDLESLSAEVDGALPEPQRSRLRGHLALCETCREGRTRLVALKAAVRGSQPDQHPSPRLRERLEALAPPGPEARPSGSRRLAIAVAMTAASAGALSFVASMVARRPAGDGLASHLVDDHINNALRHDKPLHIVSADPAEVERWFSGNVDFAVSLPRLPGATLVGGRTCTIAGRRVALTFYDIRERRVSLFVMPPEGREDPPCTDGVRGFSVCRRRVHGVDYALVGDLPAEQARRLLEQGL